MLPDTSNARGYHRPNTVAEPHHGRDRNGYIVQSPLEIFSAQSQRQSCTCERNNDHNHDAPLSYYCVDGSIVGRVGWYGLCRNERRMLEARPKVVL